MININNTLLIVFNMQLDLIPLLHNSQKVIYGCRWVSDLFQTHKIPILLLEHKKLGQIAPSLLKTAKDATILQKHFFNITKESHIIKYITSLDLENIVLTGAEAHICLFQSAISLSEVGKKVYVLADTISSRSRNDYKEALNRLRQNNIELITQEMLFFELIDHSELPNYLDLAMKFLDGRYIN